MKSLVPIILLAAFMTSAQTQIEYTPSNGDAASQICAVAGNQGEEAAKAYAKSIRTPFHTVHCDNVPIANFLRQKTAANTPQTHINVSGKTYVPRDNNEASLRCAQLASRGMSSARKKAMAERDLYCNGKPAYQFFR